MPENANSSALVKSAAWRRRQRRQGARAACGRSVAYQVQLSTDAHAAVTQSHAKWARPGGRIQRCVLRKRRVNSHRCVADSVLRSLIMAVINKWPKCAVHFVAGNLAAAREALINEVLGYAAFRGKHGAQHSPVPRCAAQGHASMQSAEHCSHGCVGRHRQDASGCLHRLQTELPHPLPQGSRWLSFLMRPPQLNPRRNARACQNTWMLCTQLGVRDLCHLRLMFHRHRPAWHMHLTSLATPQELEQRTSSSRPRSGP